MAFYLGQSHNMSVSTTSDFISLINELSNEADADKVINDILQQLPENKDKRSTLLNPEPPTESPITLLGKKIANNQINSDYIPLLEKLISRGGNPNIPDANGLCIIHHASISYNEDTTEELLDSLMSLDSVKKDINTSPPFPVTKNIAFFMVEISRSLEQSKNTSAANRMVERLSTLVECGYSDVFFETPSLNDKSKIPAYLKTLNPANMMFGYVTETLLKGQQKDLIIEMHESATTKGNQPILTSIKKELFKKPILAAFRDDIFVDQKNLNDKAAIYRLQNMKLEALLSNEKVTVEDLEKFINNIPTEIKKTTPDKTQVISLVEKRLDFISSCDRQIDNYNKMKTIGHCLGLRGKFENGQKNVITYEQFSVDHTLPRLASQAKKYVDSVSELDSRYSTEDIALMTSSALAFDQASISRATNDYSAQADRYLTGEPVMIPCIYEDHFASAVLYKDKLYFCNKDSGCTKFPGIETYKINLDINQINQNQDIIEKNLGQIKILSNAISTLEADENLTEEKNNNLNDLKKQKNSLEAQNKWLLPNRDSLSTLISSLSTKVRYENGQNNTKYENLGLPEITELNPVLIDRKKLHGQKQGNCSYTNNKRAFEAVMLALTEDPENQQKYKNIDCRKLYQKFSTFDRSETIKDHIAHFKSQYPKDEKILDPLFNFLRYKSSQNNQNKIELTREILTELNNLGFKDKDIANKMMEVKYPPNKNITKFINIATDLKEGSQIQGKETYYLKRAAKALTPGQDKREMIKVLKEAGMSQEGISAIQHYSKSKNNKQQTQTPSTATASRQSTAQGLLTEEAKAQPPREKSTAERKVSTDKVHKYLQQAAAENQKTPDTPTKKHR